jgi:hypothetical protein
MLLHRQMLLVLTFLSVFLFTITTNMANAKTSDKISKPPTKTWARIDGFRSAKFRMSKKMVLKAINKDFKIPKTKVRKDLHPSNRTSSFEITIPKLLEIGGVSKAGYVFGHKSKVLTQINVVWGFGASKDVNQQELVTVANQLRDHFLKKRYQEDMLVVNTRLNPGAMVVFRGKDQKGRMILVTLLTPVAKKGEDPKEVAKKSSLTLSYMLDPVSPDILTIKEGDF